MKVVLLEDQSFQDIPSSLPSGKYNLRFPMKLAFSGAVRLQEMKNILQEDPSPLLERFAAYELADELVKALSLQGLQLGANGECEYLSPKRWAPAPATIFEACSIKKYFSDQQVKLAELLVPRWALPFQKKVNESTLLSLYEQMLSPVSPYLYFRVEK